MDFPEELLVLAKDPTFLSFLQDYRDDYDRRSHFDRRQEFNEWSKGVFENIKSMKADIAESKSDIKGITDKLNRLGVEVALLGKDRDIGNDRWGEIKNNWKEMHDRWEEVQALLWEIKEEGCDVYEKHNVEFTTNARADERRRIEQEAEMADKVRAEIKLGRTWPDIIAGFSPTNIILGGVVVLLLFYIFGGVDKLLSLVGLG